MSAMSMSTTTESEIHTPPSEGEGIHMRHGARKRKASLSDGVPVERISIVDRRESFDQATKDLNREIMERKSSKDGHVHDE